MIIYKGYQVKPDKTIPSMLVIVTDGKGGSIPDVFAGMYTSYNAAKSIIDNHLSRKISEEKLDDKKINKA